MSTGCWRTFLGCLALLSAGCSATTFTEADRGQTKEVYVGTEFSISLPSTQGGIRGQPKIVGSIVSFLRQRRDDSAMRDIFDFKAEGRGETDIRIPAPDGTGPGAAQDYLIRVKVKSSSESYSMPVRQ